MDEVKQRCARKIRRCGATHDGINITPAPAATEAVQTAEKRRGKLKIEEVLDNLRGLSLMKPSSPKNNDDDV